LRKDGKGYEKIPRRNDFSTFDHDQFLDEQIERKLKEEEVRSNFPSDVTKINKGDASRWIVTPKSKH
jgi:hypothetical protein